MKRWVAPIGAVIAVLTIAGLTLASPSVVYSWTLIVPPQVPLGNPLPIDILGPSHSGFTLSLYSQPFNTSHPVFEYDFTTPTSASGYASLNVTIPTTTLLLGSYELLLSTSSGNITSRVVTLENPLNITQINQNMTYIFGAIAALQAQSIRQGEAIDNQESEIAQLRWGIVFIAFVCLIYIPVSEWSRRNPGARDAIPRWWKERHTKKELNRWGEEQPGMMAIQADGRAVEDTGSDITNVRVFHPGRAWRSDKCLRCEAPQGEDELRQHLSAPSPSGHGIPKPQQGTDYWQDEDEIERQREVLRPAPRGKTGDQQWKIDLGKVN